jgi:basic amino acid/polyamine antiporter, APA family
VDERSTGALVKSVDIIIVGTAGMIGGAILILSGSAIGLAGSAVIIAFMINAINTLYSHEICRA